MSLNTENKKIIFPSKIFFLMSVCQIVTALCVIILMFNDYRNPPIQCLMDPQIKAVETYCYIKSLFTVVGIEKRNEHYRLPQGNVIENETKLKYQRYFFWLPYLLWLQVLLLGFPSYLWKVSEGGFMGRLLGSLSQIPGAREFERLADYITETLNSYKLYSLKFLGCECLGFVILTGNIFFTDWYLEGRFLNEIPLLLYQFTFTDRQDGLLDDAFPKVAKCSFHLFGGSGTLMLKDSLCVMARNLLTGRIYLLLFILYTMSAAVAALSLTWRLISLISDSARIFNLFTKVSKVSSKEDIRYIMWYCDFGDWFIIQQMASIVVNFDIFAEILRQKLQGNEYAGSDRNPNAKEAISSIYSPRNMEEIVTQPYKPF